MRLSTNGAPKVTEAGTLAAPLAGSASDQQIAYTLLRFTVGVNLLLHGLVRLPKLGEFAAGTVDQFKSTLLPAPLVDAFAHALPFVETVVGISLLVGLRTRLGVILGALTMSLLVFGTALRSDWNTLGIQMLYVLIYYVLLAQARFDAISLDNWLRRRGR